MAFSDRGMQQLAALRQKRKDATANAKPVFGPPPSKAIFEEKWLTKLQAQDRAWLAGAGDGAPARQFVGNIIRYTSTAFDLVTAFDAEAAAQGLCESDFTTQVPVDFLGRRLDFDSPNPFSAAARLRDQVYIALSKMENDGTGRSMMHGCTEVEKEQLRGELEDIRVKIFEADEAGKWDTAASAQFIADAESKLESQPGFSNGSNGKPSRPTQRRKWC